MSETQRWTIINTTGPFAKGEDYTVVGPKIEREKKVVSESLFNEALEAMDKAAGAGYWDSASAIADLREARDSIRQQLSPKCPTCGGDGCADCEGTGQSGRGEMVQLSPKEEK